MNQVTSNTVSSNKGRRPLVVFPTTTNQITVNNHTVSVVATFNNPQIVVFDNFLTPQECEELVSLSKNQLRPSTTVQTNTGAMEQHPARTSQGTFFQRGQHSVVKTIEERISAVVNWPVDHGEGLQVLNYQVNGEYRHHFDYFDPALPGSNVHLARGGQRYATLIMYLNDPESGGHTEFPRLGFSVAPRAGSAVFFANVSDNLTVDPRSEHAGLPVVAGEKWIATKWLRANKFV